MKLLFKILIFTNFLFANSNDIFMIDKYNEEIELEAKIVSTIAKFILKNENVKLFIPNMKKDEKIVYSSIVNLTNECDANFIFKKRNYKLKCNKNQFYFTNNYKQLISDEKFIGAFFWSKSRPNIVFVKKRLDKNSIILPKSFNKYIEEF